MDWKVIVNLYKFNVRCDLYVRVDIKLELRIIYFPKMIFYLKSWSELLFAVNCQGYSAWYLEPDTKQFFELFLL